MTELLIRGRVLTFVAEPQGIDDKASYRYFEDGAVFVRGGKVVDAGDHAEISKLAGADVEVAEGVRIVTTTGNGQGLFPRRKDDFVRSRIAVGTVQG